LPTSSSHLDLDLDLILDLLDHVIDVPGRMVYIKCLIGDICAMSMHAWQMPKKQCYQLLSPRYLSNPTSVCFLLLNKLNFQIIELRMKHLLVLEFESGCKAGGKITDRYGAHGSMLLQPCFRLGSICSSCDHLDQHFSRHSLFVTDKPN
jgi:hypothetical protein